jgi:hypothetical protein
MPATVELTSGTLVVNAEGADRFWALKSRLEIPIEHVVGAQSAGEEARQWLHGIRVGGTNLPGVISTGRFYSHRQLVFWDVHDPDKAIAVQLRDDRYDHLVLEVEEPEAEIARIQHALAAVPA